VPTNAVWAAAGEATARGQHLAISTGRGAFGPTLGYAQRLDPDGWHIFHNGAALLHTGTGEVRSSALAPEVVAVAADAAEANDWVVEFYSVDDYTVDTDHPYAIEHAAMLGSDHEIRDRTSLGEIVRLQFVVPIDSIPATVTAMAKADAIVVPATSPVMPGIAFVSVTSPGVSKGAAIAEVAALIGTTVDRAMMVGDGHNDLDAMQAVAHGAAMGNAVDEVKAAAAYVVADVDDGGLVEALALSATL